jgi:hypothetical protein
MVLIERCEVRLETGQTAILLIVHIRHRQWLQPLFLVDCGSIILGPDYARRTRSFTECYEIGLLPRILAPEFVSQQLPNMCYISGSPFSSALTNGNS